MSSKKYVPYALKDSINYSPKNVLKFVKEQRKI